VSDFSNDLGRPLSAPCELGVWGKKCSEEQYKSWRRIAVGLRRTILMGNWSAPGSQELYKEALAWLRKWIDPSEIDSVVLLGIEMKAVSHEADPSLEKGPRFPADLGFWQGAYNPVEGWTYVEKTTALAQYIAMGKVTYEKGVRAGVIVAKDTEIVHAEQSKPTARNWVPIIVWGGGGVVVFSVVVWAFSQIVRAVRSREAA
jgi:hypothetical protein